MPGYTGLSFAGGIVLDKARFRKDVERLKKKIKKIDPQVRVNARRISNEFGKEMADQIRRKAPIADGELRDGIISHGPPAAGFSTDEVIIYVSTQAKHSTVMDTGFKVKRITPKKGKALRIPYGTPRGIKRLYKRGMTAERYKLEVERAERLGYIFRKFVKTPKIRSGKKGPNLFFTSVWDKIYKNPDRVLNKVASRILDGV